MKKYFGLLTLVISISFASCDKDTVDDSGAIYGCIDENALNFNSSATDDNGSCEYSVSYLASGDWTITYLEYDTEIDLSVIDASILDAISPGLSLIVGALGAIPVEGSADDAGSYSLSLDDNSYTSDLSFTTEPISIVTFEIPGLPINLASSGTWSVQNSETEILFVDEATSTQQLYEIVNLSSDFALLRGALIIAQEIPGLGLYEFEVELELTLEK